MYMYTHKKVLKTVGEGWGYTMCYIIYELPEIEKRLGFMYLQVAHWTILAGLEVFHNAAFAN